MGYPAGLAVLEFPVVARWRLLGVLKMEERQTSVTITEGKFAGGTYIVDIDERVLTDPSCGQWESGWFVSVEIRGELQEWFLNESGQVWTIQDDPDNRSEQIGICPEREARFDEACARVEALYESGTPFYMKDT